MSRFRVLPPLVLGGFFLLQTVVPQAQQPASDAPYSQIGLLPRAVDGRGLNSFTFDPTTRTLYAASDYAIFRAEMTVSTPRIQEVAKRRISRIEIAPDIGRLFFLGIDEVGYLDLRDPSSRPVKIADLDAPVDLAYEPTRQELYVSTHRGPILVFDGKSAERGVAIETPGWSAFGLEATRGRVFFMVDKEFGLFSVDAATRTVAKWPVTGRISTPAHLDADPDGQYLFMAYEREFVAIDIAKASVIGRVVTAVTPSIAFDPESDTLIATWDDDPPPTRVVTYAVSEKGLTETARIDNPAIGRSGVEPMYGGFVQRGIRDLIVWGRRAGARP